MKGNRIFNNCKCLTTEELTTEEKRCTELQVRILKLSRN
jgi:hypothetical protein